LTDYRAYKYDARYQINYLSDISAEG